MLPVGSSSDDGKTQCRRSNSNGETEGEEEGVTNTSVKPREAKYF